MELPTDFVREAAIGCIVIMLSEFSVSFLEALVAACYQLLCKACSAVCRRPLEARPASGQPWSAGDCQTPQKAS